MSKSENFIGLST